MVRVKICGITSLEDALTSVEAGADALGFVFAESPRRVDVDVAKRIIDELPPFVSCVGVFVDPTFAVASSVADECGLTAVQLHGEESPELCRKFRVKVIKAFRVRNEGTLASLADYDVDAYLLDSFVEGRPGGTGRAFNWELARRAKECGRIILSGGLTPENVREAVRSVRPYAVDVSSGVEARPGKKDPESVRKFIEEAKSV
ncbi:MAG: phosphoribosylanthranilate isomerase [bacterium]